MLDYSVINILAVVAIIDIGLLKQNSGPDFGHKSKAYKVLHIHTVHIYTVLNKLYPVHNTTGSI